MMPISDPCSASQADAKLQLRNYPRASMLTTRYGDLDADGYVSDMSIARYMEQARSHLMLETMEEAGISLRSGALGTLVASVRLEMVRHCAPGPELCLAAGVSRIGRSSIDLRVALFDGDTCIAVADNVMVIVSRETGKPVPLPVLLKNALTRFSCS